MCVVALSVCLKLSVARSVEEEKKKKRKGREGGREGRGSMRRVEATEQQARGTISFWVERRRRTGKRHTKVFVSV